jgi:hypothetical protein
LTSGSEIEETSDSPLDEEELTPTKQNAISTDYMYMCSVNKIM